MRKLVLIIFLGLSLLFAGCAGVDLSGVNLSNISEEDVNKFIVCDEPYIRFGTGCCLDQNDNNICDNDESSAVEEKEDSTGFEDEKEEFEKEDIHEDLDLDIYIEIFKEDDFSKVVVEFEGEEELFFEFETVELDEIKEFLAQELDLSYEAIVHHSEVEYEYYDDKEEFYEEHEEIDLDLELEFEQGKVILEWDDYTEDDFEYYKVMFSTEIDDPKYPEDDAIYVIDNSQETEFVHYDFSETQENFYRISVVTEGDIFYHSDVVEFYFDNYERDIEIEIEIYEDKSIIEVEIDGEYEKFDLVQTDELDIFEVIGEEFDLTLDEVEEYAEVEYIDEGDDEDDEEDSEEEDEEEDESDDEEDENTNSTSN